MRESVCMWCQCLRERVWDERLGVRCQYVSSVGENYHFNRFCQNCSIKFRKSLLRIRSQCFGTELKTAKNIRVKICAFQATPAAAAAAVFLKCLGLK